MPKSSRKEKGVQSASPKSFRAPDIFFIGEQDGNAEREFKARLTMRFRADIHVIEAYLVRLRYGATAKPNIALCVAAGDKVQSQVVQAAESEFRKMFNTAESLDILFLSPEQQERIRSVASPFYRQHTYRI